MAQSQSHQTQSTSNSLFQDDGSPWDMPTPRKQHSRADLLRTLLPASDVPESYIETFDAVIREDGAGGKVSSNGVTRVLASAKLDADAQARIMSIVAPGGGDVALGRNEFNVLLGLVGLAQEGETASLDGVDERRRSKFYPVFSCFFGSLLHMKMDLERLLDITLSYTMHMQPPVPQRSRLLYLLSVTATGNLWMRPRLPSAVLSIGPGIFSIPPWRPKSSCGALDRSMSCFLLYPTVDAS